MLGDVAHLNVQRWCEGLAQAGADVHVLSLAAADVTTYAVHPLPVRRLGKLNYLAAIPAARTILDKVRPDVVAAYYVTGYGTIAAWAGFHPLVQMTSGSDILLAPRRPAMRRLVRYNLARAQLVTAWAPHMARAAGSLGVPSSRLFVLARGIPIALFAGQRCPQPSIDRPARLICTRSFAPIYRVEMLIRAAAELRRTGVAFTLTLAGTGPREPHVRALVRDLALSSVIRFPGFVSNDELPQLLAQHDVYVSMAESDGVSASLLEAMAVGLLPVVTDNEANRVWITSNHNGLLAEASSPSSVAAVIQRGIADVDVRARAWHVNPPLVREQADSIRNAGRYINRFRLLVEAYGHRA